MLNQHWITLPPRIAPLIVGNINLFKLFDNWINCCCFCCRCYLQYVAILLPQRRFFERFWRILSSPFTVPNNRRTREESFFSKGSSTGAIFSPKIALLRFQTFQQKDQKIRASPRNFRSKIHPKGPELAFEAPLFDWMSLNNNRLPSLL